MTAPTCHERPVWTTTLNRLGRSMMKFLVQMGKQSLSWIEPYMNMYKENLTVFSSMCDQVGCSYLWVSDRHVYPGRSDSDRARRYWWSSGWHWPQDRPSGEAYEKSSYLVTFKTDFPQVVSLALDTGAVTGWCLHCSGDIVSKHSEALVVFKEPDKLLNMKMVEEKKVC